MKSQIVVIALLTGLAAAAQSVDDSDQSAFPAITAQPVDQDIALGGSVVFTVHATNAEGYLWLRNGVLLDGQTNSSLALRNVGLGDVAAYSCYVARGTEAVPTRSASLSVFTPLTDGTVVVYGSPVIGSGSQGTCPGAYAGYVIYTKTLSQGWGWAPSANTTVHTAADTTGRQDTKVTYTGKSGDSGCNQTTVAVPDPTTSTKYRFAIYFPNNVPTNAYPITLTGFDQ
jgi:hypothetical protein